MEYNSLSRLLPVRGAGPGPLLRPVRSSCFVSAPQRTRQKGCVTACSSQADRATRCLCSRCPSLIRYRTSGVHTPRVVGGRTDGPRRGAVSVFSARRDRRDKLRWSVSPRGNSAKVLHRFLPGCVLEPGARSVPENRIRFVDAESPPRFFQLSSPLISFHFRRQSCSPVSLRASPRIFSSSAISSSVFSGPIRLPSSLPPRSLSSLLSASSLSCSASFVSCLRCRSSSFHSLRLSLSASKRLPCLALGHSRNRVSSSSAFFARAYAVPASAAEASAKKAEGGNLLNAKSGGLSARGRRENFQALRSTMSKRSKRPEKLHADEGGPLSPFQTHVESPASPVSPLVASASQRPSTKTDHRAPTPHSPLASRSPTGGLGRRTENEEQVKQRRTEKPIFRVEFPEEPRSPVLQAASSVSAQIRLIHEQRAQVRRLKRRQVAPLPRKHWLYMQAKRLEEMDAKAASASRLRVSTLSPQGNEAWAGAPEGKAEETAAQSIFAEDGGDIDQQIRAWRRRKGLPEDGEEETNKERRRRLRAEKLREMKRKVRWELPTVETTETGGASGASTQTHPAFDAMLSSSAPSLNRVIQLEEVSSSSSSPSSSSPSASPSAPEKVCFTWEWQEGQEAPVETAAESAQDEARASERRGRGRRERRAEVLANRQAASLEAPPHWLAKKKVEPHRFMAQLGLTEVPQASHDCMHPRSDSGNASGETREAELRNSKLEVVDGDEGSAHGTPSVFSSEENVCAKREMIDANRMASDDEKTPHPKGRTSEKPADLSVSPSSSLSSSSHAVCVSSLPSSTAVPESGLIPMSPSSSGRADSDRFADGLLDSGASLVRQLKRRALQYEATGVDPSLLDTWASSVGYFPGLERHQREQEMRQLAPLSFQSLLESGRGSTKNFNSLIKAKVFFSDTAAALDVLEKMARHGFPPDEESFVHLIGGAARRGDSACARMLFLKMRATLSSPPSARVYAALIQAHVAAQDLPSAFALLRKMEDEHIPADCVVYTVLIDGLVRAKKIRKAWRTFWTMRTWKGLEPDEVLFTVMIKACAVRGEAERAINLLDDMRASGLHPTDVTYAELMHACCDRKDFASKCFHFYHQMLAEDMPITLPVYAFLLRACAAQGNVKRAKDVVRQMVRENVSFSSYMYTLVIRVFASAMRLPRVSDAERIANLRYAWHLVQDMRAKGVEIETKTLNALLEVYIAGGFSQYAVEMLKQYHVLGCEPDIYTYKALLTMFARDLKDVGRFFALWDFMRRHTSLSPPPALLHLALSTAMDSQSASRTVKVLQEMYALKVFPTPHLTDRLARVGREITAIHEMIGLFVKLQKQDVFDKNRKEQQLLQTQIDEHELKVFAERGVPLKGDATPEQEVRKEFFDKQDKLKKAKFGGNRRPWLPLGEFLQSKQKGGEAYAKRHDRPRPPPEVDA
ncbi:pentatricopeptide repeat domain-containing protein [Toxoplasma gondii VAND]|uniref:Pentatricopeptide repeat domain-containing protein n=1 Tax=Toxoplasma gondii VAND TaxID=933077 RepID=A0A086PWN2_TOXGO|nr:pentatricopeptide repeat domain-containing protein [Toxoplasma gondii VAND]